LCRRGRCSSASQTATSAAVTDAGPGSANPIVVRTRGTSSRASVAGAVAGAAAATSAGIIWAARDHTRGGRKLEAAFAHFKLATRVRGVHALDLGASTGGFVAVLLAHGARHVTAIDVGHGQLLADLARDQRVTSLERTDFKTLSLAVASGPFDFFTVDVGCGSG